MGPAVQVAPAAIVPVQVPAPIEKFAVSAMLSPLKVVLAAAVTVMLPQEALCPTEVCGQVMLAGAALGCGEVPVLERVICEAGTLEGLTVTVSEKEPMAVGVKVMAPELQLAPWARVDPGVQVPEEIALKFVVSLPEKNPAAGIVKTPPVAVTRIVPHEALSVCAAGAQLPLDKLAVP